MLQKSNFIILITTILIIVSLIANTGFIKTESYDQNQNKTSNEIEDNTPEESNLDSSLNLGVERKFSNVQMPDPVVNTSRDNDSFITEGENITINWYNFNTSIVGLYYEFSGSFPDYNSKYNFLIGKDYDSDGSFTWNISFPLVPTSSIYFKVVSDSNSSIYSNSKTFTGILGSNIFLSSTPGEPTLESSFSKDELIYLYFHVNVNYDQIIVYFMKDGNEEFVKTYSSYNVLKYYNTKYIKIEIPWELFPGNNYQLKVGFHYYYSSQDSYFYSDYFDIVDLSPKLLHDSIGNLRNITEGDEVHLDWDPTGFNEGKIDYVKISFKYSKTQSVIIQKKSPNVGHYVWNSLINLSDTTSYSKVDNLTYELVISNYNNDSDLIETNKFKISLIPRVFIDFEANYYPTLKWHNIGLTDIPNTFSAYLYKNGEFFLNLTQNFEVGPSNIRYYPYDLDEWNYIPGDTYSYVLEYNSTQYFSEEFTTKSKPAIISIEPDSLYYYGSVMNVSFLGVTSARAYFILYGHNKKGSVIQASYLNTVNNGSAQWKIQFSKSFYNLNSLNSTYDYFYFSINQLGRNYISAKFHIKYIVPPKPTNFVITLPKRNLVWYKGYYYLITWKDVPDNKNVGIELYQNNSLKMIIKGELNNENYYIWKIPNDIEEGNNYSVKIAVKGEETYSYQFSPSITILSKENNPIYYTTSKTNSANGFQDFVLVIGLGVITLLRKIKRKEN